MGSPAIGNAASRISIDADAAVNDVRHGNHRVHDALPTPEELNAGIATPAEKAAAALAACASQPAE